jgi:uncharacterized membrane protein
MLIVGLVLIVAVFFALNPGYKPNFSSNKHSEAEELLKKRFVSGEIDEATYRKMLEILRSK